MKHAAEVCGSIKLGSCQVEPAHRLQEGLPIPKRAAGARIAIILENMCQNRRRGTQNVLPEPKSLPRLIMETIGAKDVVGSGPSRGHSARWLCLGPRTTGSKLIRREIDPHRAWLAREKFTSGDVDEIVTLIEGDTREEVTKLKERSTSF